MKRRPLGRSGLEVTPICLGCAPLGSMRRDFGYEVPLERALDTLRAFFSSGLNFLDTSNGYGGGESEKRIGIVLAEMGELPPGFVLSTKIDPDPETGSFDGDRAWRSLEESLGRLGVDHVDLLHLHDPERIGFDLAMAKGGPVQALVAMREQGLATAIGVAGGP